MPFLKEQSERILFSSVIFLSYFCLWIDVSWSGYDLFSFSFYFFCILWGLASYMELLCVLMYKSKACV